MGVQHSRSFSELSQTHMRAFLIYVDATRANDEKSATEAIVILEENVEHCKKECSARIPGCGIVIGSRFMSSMKAELQLLEDPEAAVTELKSCHKTIVKGLSLLFGNKETWENLWGLQLQAMLDYLIAPNETSRQACLQTALNLGLSFDSLAGSKIPV